MCKQLIREMNINQHLKHSFPKPLLRPRMPSHNDTFPFMNHTKKRTSSTSPNNKQFISLEKPLMNCRSKSCQLDMSKSNNFAASEWSDSPPATELPKPPTTWTVSGPVSSVDSSLKYLLKMEA